MTRLAYVCEDRGIPLDGRKGSSAHVRAMAAAFAEGGTHVTIFSPRPGDGRWIEGRPIELVELPRRPDRASRIERNRWTEAMAAFLDRHHAARPFDAVYERLSLFAESAARWSRAAGVPRWIEVNAPLADEAARYRKLREGEEARGAEVLAIKTADLVLAVSPWLVEWARRLGCDEKRTRLLPNGVPSEWLIEDDRAGAAPDPREPFVIGFVGSLRPWHGLDCLIEAFARLNPGRFKLRIVGDGPMRDEVEAAIQSSPPGSIEWLGAVDPGAVPKAIDAMDACVAPYPALDPFYFCPIKIFEYAARRRPVIASSVPELTRQFPANALLEFRPGDAADLAGRIEWLAGHRDAGSAAASKLHEFARDHTWAAHARQVLDWGGLSRGAPVQAAEGHL